VVKGATSKENLKSSRKGEALETGADASSTIPHRIGVQRVAKLTAIPPWMIINILMI
jgi:hypothetical protein